MAGAMADMSLETVSSDPLNPETKDGRSAITPGHPPNRVFVLDLAVVQPNPLGGWQRDSLASS